MQEINPCWKSFHLHRKIISFEALCSLFFCSVEKLFNDSKVTKQFTIHIHFKCHGLNAVNTIDNTRGRPTQC